MTAKDDMTTQTITHSITHYEAHGGVRYELPFGDPYNNSIIDDTIMITPGRNLSEERVRYLVADEFGFDASCEEEVMEGWQVHWARNGPSMTYIESLMTECRLCGVEEEDHGKLGDHDAFTDDKWDHSFLPSTEREAIVNGRAFWIDKYEHGQVRYTLAADIAPSWDTSACIGLMIADDDWGDVDLEQIAASTLEAYSSWCNGEVYSIVEATYVIVSATKRTLIDYESVGGYIGFGNAEEILEGDLF